MERYTALPPGMTWKDAAEGLAVCSRAAVFRAAASRPRPCVCIGIIMDAGAALSSAVLSFHSSEVTENPGAFGWEIPTDFMTAVDAVLARRGCVTVVSGWLED